jgi:hypothetical protein
MTFAGPSSESFASTNQKSELAGEARTTLVADRSAGEVEAVHENEVDPEPCLIDGEAKAFIAAAEKFAKHETVCHSKS